VRTDSKIVPQVICIVIRFSDVRSH